MRPEWELILKDKHELLRLMHQFKRDRQFRRNHPVKFQRVYGTKEGGKSKHRRPKRNDPFDLDHTCEDRHVTKMSVEVEQVTWRN